MLILGLGDMQVGMRVEVTRRYSPGRQNGLVVNVEETKKSTWIDGKPIVSRKVKEVKIAYNQGGEITLNECNIRNYQIQQIG